MDYVTVLKQCEEATVGNAVLTAVQELFKRDIKLMQLGAKEETIAAQMANYLRPYFPRFNVDVEYSRMGDAPKKVTYDIRPQKVYPDIIVHIRDNRAAGIPDSEANVLAIELKKDSNTEESERDIRKLGAYRTELGYRHALFVRLGTKKSAGEVLECQWVDV